MSEEVLHREADPIKIKLIKGQKESYGWEISIKGASNIDIIRAIQEADTELRTKYLSKSEEGE